MTFAINMTAIHKYILYFLKKERKDTDIEKENPIDTANCINKYPVPWG